MNAALAVLAEAPEAGAVPIHCVTPDSLPDVLGGLDEPARRFAAAQGFKAQAGRHVLLPDAEGGIAAVLFGLGAADAPERTPFLPGRLAADLPEGVYRLAGAGFDPQLAAAAFALGAYRYERYRKPKQDRAHLVAPEGCELDELARIVDGVFLARDLVNTPANDLGPAELAEAARAAVAPFGAEVAVVAGEELASGFPMVHAVGAGSDRPPRLVDIRWGAPDAPRVTLVGKGVVFDTGGVDIKTAAGMALMKKDMGGAANVLGLATMIMSRGLKLRLRVLVPAVENAVSGRAFRPGDVLRSRKGLSVEIGNTDAEGRLILADALALADEEAPELIVSMATLTGAARVALGPEVPPFFTDDESFAAAIAAASGEVYDPVWRLPLWRPYDSWLSSKIADLSHIAGNSYAGSVVAALFLDRFVEKAATFAHFDIFAWNPSARPGGPEGGEAQAIRALYRYLAGRFG